MFCSSSPSLLITLVDLSNFLLAQPALSPSNLYRKQYGNLEHIFAVEEFGAIFLVENSVVRLKNMRELRMAQSRGSLTPALLQQCEKMHRFKRAHDIQTLKINDKNECTRCGQAYPEIINGATSCGGRERHEPRFDFGEHPHPDRDPAKFDV
jgi:hypothetical protein